MKIVIEGQPPSWVDGYTDQALRVRFGADTWARGSCTCPMQVDCKHVAAVLLFTRDRLATSEAPVSPWESRLADVVRPAAGSTAGPRVGLQLEVVGNGPARLRLRLVRPGKAGRWGRTGMSWP